MKDKLTCAFCLVNPRREPSAFEIVQEQAAVRRTQNQANGEREGEGNDIGAKTVEGGAQHGRGKNAD